jgi:hypothetical protein
MKRRIEEFKAPKTIKDSLSGAIIEDDVIIYRLVFDSVSSKNETLYYKVECKLVADNDYHLRVLSRAKAWSATSH